jgi:hypothetical protein
MFNQWLTDQEFIQKEENVFSFKFSFKDDKVLENYFKNQRIEFLDGFFNIKNNKIKIDSSVLEITKLNDSLTEEDFKDIVLFLKNETIVNIVDYIIFKNEPILYDSFFQLVEEKHLKYSFLKTYLNDLKKLELNFDTSKMKSFNKNEEFIAINCVDYIKFIEYDEFNEEKKILSLVNEVKEYYSESPEITEWVEVHFFRHLRKNSFNSNEIYHIIDWMRSLEDKSILKHNMPYPKALSRADRWVTNQDSNHKLSSFIDIEGKDITTLFSLGSYELVHLISEDAKVREGVKMKNCIKTHHVQSSTIHSIRHQGKRIASLDIRDGVIKELKGPVNKEVAPKYWDGVYSLLLKSGINPLESHNDLSNIGLTRYRLNVQGKEYNFIGSGNKSNNSDIEGLFFLKKDSQIEDIIANITSKLDDKNKEELSSLLLTFYKDNYKQCPFSGYVIGPKDVLYSISMNNIFSIVKKYDENLIQTFHELIENQIETKRESFTLIFSKVIESILNNHKAILTDSFSKEKRILFFKELVGSAGFLSNEFQYHMALYNPDLKANSIVDSILYDLGLDSFVSALNNVIAYQKIANYNPKVLKINPSCEYDHIDDMKNVSPSGDYECPFCDNQIYYNKYREQEEIHSNSISKIEELIKDERKSGSTEISMEALSFSINFISKIVELNTNIKLNPQGFPIKVALTQFNKIIHEFQVILESNGLNPKQVSKAVSEMGDFVNEVISNGRDLEESINNMEDSIYRIEECKGCSHCNGESVYDDEDNEIECPECLGESDGCDLKSILDSPDGFNLDVFLKQFEDINEERLSAYSRRGFDASWIDDVFREVYNFIDDARDSKRKFIDSL